MKFKSLFSLSLLALGIAAALTPPARAIENVFIDAGGVHVGTATTDKVGFHDATASTQRAGAAQAAITDSTTGTAGDTAAAGVGVNTITIPLTSLATGLSTSAIDLLTEYVPGYRFKVLKFDFVATVVGAGSSASQVFNLEIETTNVTGGALTVTLASTNTIGKITSGTSITAANVGTATQKLSIEMAAGGTVFTAGAGYFVIMIQNMDTADAHAAEIQRITELRAALVEKGLIKGGA